MWIGLFTSLLILVEAVTGLLLAEPLLMGINKPSPEQRVEFEKLAKGEVVGSVDFEKESAEADGHFKPPNQVNSLMGFVKNLHTGRIGNTNVSFLLDIVAIGLIILTITGIILSIKALKVQNSKHGR